MEIHRAESQSLSTGWHRSSRSTSLHRRAASFASPIPSVYFPEKNCTIPRGGEFSAGNLLNGQRRLRLCRGEGSDCNRENFQEVNTGGLPLHRCIEGVGNRSPGCKFRTNHLWQIMGHYWQIECVCVLLAGASLCLQSCPCYSSVSPR